MIRSRDGAQIPTFRADSANAVPSLGIRRRNLWAIYPIAILLASCTGKPPVTVSVPVAVPCIAPDKVPQLPPPLGAMPEDANAALSLAIDRLLDWRLYGIAADGVMRGCAGVK